MPRFDFSAVTHVDCSAHIQTVYADINPRYHLLVSRLKEITGCPVVVSTSFNVRGERTACMPEDAFRCFMGAEIEVMVAGNCYLRKKGQNASLKRDYKIAFELD